MFVRNHNWSVQLQKLERLMVFYLSSQRQSQLEWCCSDGWVYMDDWQVWCYIFFPLQLYLLLLFLSIFFSMSKTLESFLKPYILKTDSLDTRAYSLHMDSLLWLPGNAFMPEIKPCAGFIFEMYTFTGHFYDILKLQILRAIQKSKRTIR